VLVTPISPMARIQVAIARLTADIRMNHIALEPALSHESRFFQHTRGGSILDIARCLNPDSPCRLAVVDTGDNRMIGTIGFHTVSEVNRSAELAFDFAPDYWGRGIATAMCSTVTQWSYRAFSLIRLQATVLGEQPPIRACIAEVRVDVRGTAAGVSDGPRHSS
jgi:RimJ/RimL family protein N-acetyltransferase